MTVHEQNGPGAEFVRRFELFGSTVGVLVGAPRSPGADAPQLRALAVEAGLRRAHHALTRFDAGSELSSFNADPGTIVAVSPLIAAVIAAAEWAARTSRGLVDATVVDAVEAAGYRESRQGAEPAPLADALAAAPARRPAIARSPSPWDRIEVDPQAGVVARAAGLRFDPGGIAKGLLADRYANTLGGYSSFAIDCGGDVRIGGTDGLERSMEVADPFTGRSVMRFRLTRGAVATSGLRQRIWPVDGGYAHHLIDPGRGVPAWTGLVQATAVAPTALEAETLAKAALLSGPGAAADLLGRSGGVVFDDSGEPTAYGPLGSRLEPIDRAVAA